MDAGAVAGGIVMAVVILIILGVVLALAGSVIGELLNGLGDLLRWLNPTGRKRERERQEAALKHQEWRRMHPDEARCADDFFDAVESDFHDRVKRG